MASFLLLPTASPLSTAPKHSSSKTLHHPLRVSCSASDGKAAGGVDRRNMLLGLGGLYGAANLVATPGANAAPILAPELDKCDLSKYKDNGENGAQHEINCCPPYTPSDKIIDYKLPAVTKMKVRPSAHRLSAEQIFKYNMAIDRMKRLPKDDPRSFMQQANVHCAYCNGGYNQTGQASDVDLQVHNSWLFFPFHRWYLYFYERILGKLINDPNFALPFWNWDNPMGMTIPKAFMDPKSALYDSKRNPTREEKSVVDLGILNKKDQNGDPLNLVVNNLAIMHQEMVRGNITAEDFMGKPFRAGDKEDTSKAGRSEAGSHTAIHVWTGDNVREAAGENMGNFYSAGRDPLFYCHHSNVDRMWTLWQYFLPSEKVPDKKITDPDFLNAAFVFYDENAQLVRVTVKDCLDNLKMGYEFERIDLPWLDYRPPAQTSRVNITKLRETAPNASTLFPLKLEGVVRFQVNKAKKGKAKELLILENITVDTSKFLKFDVFVNDEDDDPSSVAKASYVGTYAQVPHKSTSPTVTTSVRMNLTNVYEDIDVADDDTVVVTLVPRHQGAGVTIGGIKIIEEPSKEDKPSS